MGNGMNYDTVYIDHSLTSTSLYFPEPDKFFIFCKTRDMTKDNLDLIFQLKQSNKVSIYSLPYQNASPLDIIRNIGYIKDILSGKLELVKTVYIEGISFGSKSGSKHKIAGNYFLLIQMFVNAQKIFEIPAINIKKSFTGTARADKEEMVLKFLITYRGDDKLIEVLTNYMKNKNHKKIYAPVTDLVDSYAIGASNDL